MIGFDCNCVRIYIKNYINKDEKDIFIKILKEQLNNEDIVVGELILVNLGGYIFCSCSYCYIDVNIKKESVNEIKSSDLFYKVIATLQDYLNLEILQEAGVVPSLYRQTLQYIKKHLSFWKEEVIEEKIHTEIYNEIYEKNNTSETKKLST